MGHGRSFLCDLDLRGCVDTCTSRRRRGTWSLLHTACLPVKSISFPSGLAGLSVEMCKISAGPLDRQRGHRSEDKAAMALEMGEGVLPGGAEHVRCLSDREGSPCQAAEVLPSCSGNTSSQVTSCGGSQLPSVFAES